jgi:hypothetical protein
LTLAIGALNTDETKDGYGMTLHPDDGKIESGVTELHADFETRSTNSNQLIVNGVVETLFLKLFTLITSDHSL